MHCDTKSFFIIVCLWCVAVSHSVLQSSYPPSLRNIAVWSSWYREDPAGQSCGQRQWYELHQHQGELGFCTDSWDKGERCLSKSEQLVNSVTQDLYLSAGT